MTFKNVIRLFFGLILVAFIFGVDQGCSRDELSEPPPKSPKVVRAIETPAVTEDRAVRESPEKEKAGLTEPEEKKSPKPGAGEGQGKEKESVEVTPKDETGQKIGADVPPQGRHETGTYAVKEGDTLARIAARDDVYGHSLKWPILYRLNYDQLNYLAESDNLPHQKLPVGLKLKIITEEERKRTLQKRKDRFWVVNILSSTKDKKIVNQTAKLIEKGYPVYITDALIKDKKWQRLRVGFFKTKKEADELGRDIMSSLDLTDSWSTKIGDMEFGEFAGY